MTTTATPKKRAAPDTTNEDEAAKKAKKRQEEDAKLGEEVIKTVRRAYFDDAKQTSVIYDVWATVLCGNTFSKCMSDAATMSNPAEARERALQVIRTEYIDGTPEAKQFLTHLIETRAAVLAPATTPTELKIEVDVLNGAATALHQDAWPTVTPQTQMVFVCKYTGVVLGKTGEGFAFADVEGDSAIIKDQWGCLLNFLRAHIALFTKSKFFDIKKNPNRGKAASEIDHAVQCAKAQLAANIETHYDAAVDAAALLLDGLRLQRAALSVPVEVEQRKGAHAAALERLRLHDAKFEHLFAIDDDDDVEIQTEMHRLRTVCQQKRTALAVDAEAASDAYSAAKMAASEVMDEMATLDASIAAAASRRRVEKGAELGRMVDAMVEGIVQDFIERRYYQPFRDLLYLFDHPKALPSLLGQLKRICASEAVRAEACFAFVIGINRHFRGGGA